MRVGETVKALIQFRPIWRDLKKAAGPRNAAIRRFKAEPQWTELKRLAGKHSTLVVHTLLMGEALFFIVMCTMDELHDPRGMIAILRASDAFTPEQRAQLELAASHVDALFNDLQVGPAPWSDDLALLGYALIGYGSRFAAYAADRGLDPAEAIARLDALPHLDEYGRELVRHTANRLTASRLSEERTP